ncbi:tyrosine-protein phosphatase [Spirillospora sp. NBC_01491]|uniref:tyrosine-protein phosphatase n=1 Tax=Spirillospora sp. NBC_01491 TaxID=2976007 RepID=UPI002E306CA7|nr:tyrosine-protein phosphatase [Spirillospora sp. NBC_01491]
MPSPTPRSLTAALTAVVALVLAPPATASAAPAPAAPAPAALASAATGTTGTTGTANAAGLASASSTVPAAVRVIQVDGAVNVRDVGGYPARGGRHVRQGLVYRSASLSGVTPAGVAALGRLGLTAAVDFRAEIEAFGSGPDRLPAGVAAIAAPINPASPALLDLGPELLKAILAEDKPAALVALSYRGFVHDPDSRRRFAAALRRIAGGRGPVLYHCSAGKDRTGTMTAILLTALGVDRARVYADYLRSNRELAEQNAATLAELKKYGLDPSLVEPLLTVRAAYLDAAFDQIEQDYGTFDAFLTKGLGIDAATKGALRSRLLR